MAISAIEKVRLIKQLRDLRVEVSGLGAGPAAAVKKLKIVKAMRDVREKLGLSAAKADPMPPAEPVSQASSADVPDVILAGNELGEFPDTEDGKKAMRQAAASVYEKLIDGNAWVDCPALGQDAKVELRTQGKKKAISQSADVRKLKIIPKLRELIKASKKVGHEKPNYDMARSPNIAGYQTMRALVSIDGEPLAVRFVLGRDDKGVYHYDHSIFPIEAIFDSAKAIGPAEASPKGLMGWSRGFAEGRSADAEPYRLLSRDPSHEHQDSIILDDVGATVNIQVLNLFIEGEAAELVIGDDDTEASGDIATLSKIADGECDDDGKPVSFGLKRSGIKTRERINSQVSDIVAQIIAGRDPEGLTDEEKELFVQYSGKGGLTENSQYEYYTPPHVAEGCWDILKENGFVNGNALEPAAGAGVFVATKMPGVVMTGTEIDPVAATVNKVMHPGDLILNQSFEKLAVSAPDNHFDAVVGNVPFGDARGPSAADDPAYRAEKRIERYFIQRVIDKTRPGGLITLVVPVGVVGNKSGPWKAFRAAISRKAEFLGAHKLPSKTFSKQGTSVVTDIIVLRKHSDDLLGKVDALPADTLAAANVLWDEFISGGYWQGEGKRFIHGTYVPPQQGKLRAMEEVIPESGLTPESLKQKLAVRFDSRIDWALLDAAEPVVNAYQAGDRRIINGKEREFDGAQWAEVTYDDAGEGVDAVKYGAATQDALRRLVSSPQSMLALSADQAFRIYKDFPNLLPDQMKMAVEFSQSQGLDAFREQAYRGSLIGSLVTQYLARANMDVDGDHDGDRATVKALVEREFATFGHPRSAKGFYLEGEMARYFGAYLNAVDEKGHLSAALSDGVSVASGYDAENPLSVAEYLSKSRPDGLISIEAFKLAYEGKREISGLGDIADVDGIAFTTDGQITTTRLYCCGDIYAKAGEIMAVMENEADPRMKARYQSQIDLMMSKARRTGIDEISFGLRDKWIKPAYKSGFLKASGYDMRYMVEAEKSSDTGETYMGAINDVESADPNGTWVCTKTKNDFARQLEHYMNGRSIGHNLRDKGGESAQDREERMREQVEALEEQFTAYMQTREDFADIERSYNVTFNSYVKPEYDTGDLGLQGISGNIQPHWYQNMNARRLSDVGAGILGDDVGLGKTTSAIAFSLYDRQMGRSSKHCIAVPKSVLANWYMESKNFIGSHDGVLFVGFEPKRDKNGQIKTDPVLDESGNPKINKHTGQIEFQDMLVEDDAAAVFEKMHSIPQSTVGLVVMTYEKFAMIPMREESRMKYAEKWAERSMMSNADVKKIGKSYNEAKAEDRAKGDFSDDGTKKKQELPYFEDMGFDRVIVDECHSFKNSFSISGEGMDRIAYLPNPTPSQRGRDMAMKMAWLREKYDNKGPIALTATPVANSPVEIFNMLSLVIDHAEFERLGIYTPDDFVRQFGIIRNVEKVRVSGEVVNTEGLAGFRNLNALRGLFHRFADMKNAKDVDPEGDVLKLPDGVEMIQQVTMVDEQHSLYATLRAEAKDAGNPKAIKAGLARPMFAVIRDMDRVTTDLDLYNNTITFLFKAADAAKVEGLINALPASIKTKIEDEDSGEKSEFSVAKAGEFSRNGDTLTYVAPAIYEDAIVTLFKKFGIEYANHPLMPKYAQLIKNMQAELDSKGKQIVFTEEKSQHGKILRLIVNHLPVTADQVAIINADTAGGEKLQQISDAFNRGDVRIIIANKKAEVGVNLQKGTSAIHHLTLPWNPASIQQRNGRGLRQGNTAPQVRIYYYQARGSFDEYRLDLLKAKGNWIAALMDKNNNNDTADNAEAMGAMEQAALLAENRDEFMKMMAKQKAKKDAEAKEKRETSARVKLNQLAAVTNSLKNFAANCERAIDEAKEAVKRERASLDKLMNDGAEADALARRESSLRRAEMRLNKLPSEWERKRAEYESTQRQLSAFLKGAAKKDGGLPFDSALIDNPGGFVLTSARILVAVGKTYQITTGQNYGRQTTRICKVASVDFGSRSCSFAMLIGLYHGNENGSGDVDSVFDGAAEVSYTPDEIEIMKMLTKDYSYAALRELPKDIFVKYRDQIRMADYALVRDDSGALSWAWLNSESAGLAIYPDPDDKQLLEEMGALYKRHAVGDYTAPINGRNFSDAARAVYGAEWKDVLSAFLNNASDADMTAKASELVNSVISDQPAATTSELSERNCRMLDSWGTSESLRARMTEWMTASGYDNLNDVRQAIGAALVTAQAVINQKTAQLKADEELAKDDAIRNDPNFKEIPGDVAAKFAAIGIEVSYNKVAVVTEGFKGRKGTSIPAFSRLWMKDRSGKNGRLFAMKEMLKGRFGASWCSSITVGPASLGGSWTVPATSSIDDVYSLLA